MNDVATVLLRLIIASEAVMTMRDPGDDEALANEVLAWFGRPADQQRVVHRYTIMLCEAMCNAAHARRQGNANAGAIYYQIMGVTLPAVRADLAVAYEQRNRPTP